MNSEWLQIVRHPEQSEGSLLCGRTHESPSPPALSHRREREPVEEYATNQWRTLEASTHKPGALGSLVHKRVYTHTNGDATPDAWADYTYGYDAVGNVYCVWDDDGNEVFYFAQDAFGNELPVDLLGQDSWSDARTLGVSEHQTGKWIDPFTGFYYFHARFYDSVVGRFVSRDVEKGCSETADKTQYAFCGNSPSFVVDPTGNNCVNQSKIEKGIYLCRKGIFPSFLEGWPPGHCYLVVHCGETCTTYAGHRPSFWPPLNSSPIQMEKDHPFDEFNPDKVSNGDCVRIGDCCGDARKCIGEKFDAYVPTDYKLLGDNSNTVASCILHRCGLGREQSHRCSWGWSSRSNSQRCNRHLGSE